MDYIFWISVLIGLGCAALTVAGLAFLACRPTRDLLPHHDETLSLLFKGNRLVDADNAIWPLLPDTATAPDWPNVRQALLPYVPNLPGTLSELSLDSAATGVGLTIEPHDTGYRLTLYPLPDQKKDWFQAKQNEIAVARMQPALIHAPDPMWSVDQKGDFISGNDAFHRYADAYGGARAFVDHIDGLLGHPDGLRSKRIKLSAPELVQARKCWLEVTPQETETGVLYFATSIDAVVRAEEAQRNFVQTLSKTFANLTTGLAIFDRDRRLALFNPALIDLSGVSVEFLSSRPALFEFFDKLRERQVMPEPKNYDDWRERMAKLVAAASDDRFRETWNLAGGQTLDVTGRPYPDGAIAFLFNDITAEVSLTRGFRTELETMQSMLDAMEDAFAVFNQQGVLTLCNAAYKLMWKVDPDTCIAESTIMDATQEWKSAFHPTPVWPELRDYVISTTERASWDSELRAKDGREVVCRIDPICYGATLIRFCHASRRRDTSSEKDGLQIVSA